MRLRIALCGPPGAGKSTSGRLLASMFADAGAGVVSIATPLYGTQRAFDRIIPDRFASDSKPSRQDGRLLNFLGQHAREILPTALVEDFLYRCELLELSGVNVIVCDDARPADLPALHAAGFAIVRLTAPDAVRLERKAQRGDFSAGADEHVTELGHIDDRDLGAIVIDNSGDMDHLRDQLTACAQAAFNVRQSSRPRPSTRPERRLAADLAQFISARYQEGRHQIGAVVVDSTGSRHYGLHLEAMVGRASICAEATALGGALSGSADGIRLAAAIRHPKPSESLRRIELVPPCGLCRELLLDYSPKMHILVGELDRPELIKLEDLLPRKYVGSKWSL